MPFLEGIVFILLCCLQGLTRSLLRSTTLSAPQRGLMKNLLQMP